MLEADRERLEQENRELGERVAELEGQLAQPQPVTLPLGEIPPGQQFGAGMMALCVNLARQIGLRPTIRALQIIFRWLGVQERIPTYQTIRGWMQRIGLDRMQNAQKIAGGVWLTDHTNQIGKEKVLTVLRVRKFRPGVPLRHKDVEVVALVPGQQWKREDVAKVYQETAKRCGDPRAIESDGAVELREPAETMGKAGKRPFVIRDPKHFLANQLEALLKQDSQYEAFTKQLGGTRSALQQTELAHFIPRNFKIKARFMNLAPTLEWASTMLWHLDHPQSKSRQGITEERMTEKLGWLRDFAPNIQQWQECQDVISTGLTFLNEQGLFRGVATQFENHVANLSHNPLSRRLVQKTVEVPPRTRTKAASWRATADEHRNPGIQLFTLQATRKAAFQKWVHQPATNVPDPAQADHAERNPRGLPARQDSRRKEMGTRPSADHTRFKTPARLSRTSAHNQSKNPKGRNIRNCSGLKYLSGHPDLHQQRSHLCRRRRDGQWNLWKVDRRLRHTEPD